MDERVRRILQKRVFDNGLQRQVAVAGPGGLVRGIVGHRVVVPHFSHQRGEFTAVGIVGQHQSALVGESAGVVAATQRVIEPLDERLPGIFKYVVAGRFRSFIGGGLKRGEVLK